MRVGGSAHFHTYQINLLFRLPYVRLESERALVAGDPAEFSGTVGGKTLLPHGFHFRGQGRGASEDGLDRCPQV